MTRSEKSLPTLSVAEASAMLIGIVVGIGIFKTPIMVAANSSSDAVFIGLWIAGGLLMMVGALCYAELGSAHPNAGGEYHYLNLAYGRLPGFLFAWGRISVMQSGAIAAVAFAYGDYAATLIPLGPAGAALHGAIAIAALAILQLLGTGPSGRGQLVLTVMTVALVLVMALCAFLAGPAPAESALPESKAAGSAGLALVFILLTYGGWNETAYLTGELKDAKRNLIRVLMLGTGFVTLLYVIVNLALLGAFGLEGLRQQSVLTEPVGRVLGTAGSVVVGLAVCTAALSTLNATMFTGARTIYALGQDFPPFSALGQRSAKSGTPVNAILAQAAIVLGLIALGSNARDGFSAMVEYTAPVFWGFLLLIGLSLFIFRGRERGREPSFRVPLYPLTPLIFCATCLYLLYASLVHTGTGALVGVAVLAVGVPLYFLGTAGRTLPAPEKPGAHPERGRYMPGE